MSEHQLDLFNDNDKDLGGVKAGDTLHIWYTNGRELEEPDLYCEVVSVDGYGEVEFWVINGAWDGVLYRSASPILKIYGTGKVIQVNKYKIIESKAKPKESSSNENDAFWDDDIAF
jgi:hypothetical protein